VEVIAERSRYTAIPIGTTFVVSIVGFRGRTLCSRADTRSREPNPTRRISKTDEDVSMRRIGVSVNSRRRGSPRSTATFAGALVLFIVVLSSIADDSGIGRIAAVVSLCALALAVTFRATRATRDNRIARAALVLAAQTDSLTGLPNRALLLERLDETLRQSSDQTWRGQSLPTLFFIDLDRFKHINDSLGHSAGDQVLRIVADRLRTVAPPRTTVARISGDEYAVFDPQSPSLADSMDLGNRLLLRFREPLALEIPECEIFVTASIGVARIGPQTQRDGDLLLRHADTAMYQAKDAGRNCVALFDEGKNERASHRLSVETALFRAMERDELRLHYQPILETTTGEVTGFEALMRWQQADGTVVSPAEFIPIAEETGTIVAMGAWALVEAMTQLRTWIDEDVCSPRTNMSVNVSPRQLADPTFSNVVNEALTHARLSPSLLWLEVTEGIMICEPDVALATLRRLRSLGVRIAIDDFGTGYSSLSSLQQFPLQRIKIDRAFVQGVAHNSNDRSLVRTIIAMGASLGLDMVAEGVETVAQMEVLGMLGCTKAQGYLISRPIPPEAMRDTVVALERMGRWQTREATAEYANATDWSP
jgi:diguanylate cyclase (GGDEF)-like protein